MEETETAQVGEELVIAVGITGSRKSKYILRWALDKFLPESNVTFKLLHVYPKISSVPTPMGNWIPISRVREDVASGYRQEIEWKKIKSLLPYQQALKARKVKSDIIMLESDDVAMAITLKVAKLAIKHLVVGASSSSIFSRKNLSLKKMIGEHISTTITETAPDFCSVYVIADRNLVHMRPAFSEASAITADSMSGLSSVSTDSSSGSPSLTIGRLLKSGPSSPRHQTTDASQSFTVTSQHEKPEFLPQNNKIPRRLVRESVELKHYNISKAKEDENNMGPSLGISRFVSHSSSSSESWGSDRASPSGLPPGSLMETTPTESRVGTPPPSSVAFTPPAVSLAGIPPSGSSPMLTGFAQNMQPSELERLRIELKRIQEMYEMPQNSDFNRKLSDFSKQQVDEEVREKIKELTSSKKNNDKAPQIEAVDSREPAQRKVAESKAETKAAHEAEENEKKLAQQRASPVCQYQKFTWKEIVEATSSFSDECKIGMGAFGTVYKCKLHHITVAIKVLHSKDSVTNKQFLQELEILSTIRHPHLLLLLGAVPEDCCLVYEYMENGSLDDRLFQKNNTPPIPWYDRIRICWEVASALAFLHSTTPHPIIHRDLKPANILLDQHLVSKIGDAGLGTMINVEPTNLSLKTLYKETSPVGTLCYIDPEYQRTGRVSTKSDVYALGVVILQLLTAKPAVGIAYLVEDAIDEGNLQEILDPEAGKWPQKETLELALLGLQCAELRGRDRPDLREKILPTLERLKDMADSARESASTAPTTPSPHFICPILKEIMEDPYVAADGYTYDRRAIELWLEENDTSPTTDLPLPHKFIMPNTTLLEAIKQWKSKSQTKK